MRRRHRKPKEAMLLLNLIILIFAACGEQEKPNPGISTPPAAARAEGTEKEVLVLTFLGDIMAHDTLLENPPYDFIWDHLREYLLEDHLTFANLEFPVLPGLKPEGYPMFNGSPEYLRAAVMAGVEVFSLANNHSNDQGPLGIDGTIDLLSRFSETKNISFSGTRKSEEEPFTPVSIETSSFRIGFIAAAEFANSPFGEELLNLVPLSDPGKKEEFLTLIGKTAAGSDLLIVSYHGGEEYTFLPDREHREFYRQLWRQGADIVWAHHPHILQPWEYIEEEGRRGVIFYSAGNTVSGQRMDPDFRNPGSLRSDTGDGAAFRVFVIKKKGAVRVLAVKPLPFTNYPCQEKGITIIPFKDLPYFTCLSLQEVLFYREREIITRRRLLPWMTRNTPAN